MASEAVAGEAGQGCLYDCAGVSASAVLSAAFSAGGRLIARSLLTFVALTSGVSSVTCGNRRRRNSIYLGGS